MQVTFSARIQNRQWRHDVETGFLRVTATILKLGVMRYTRAELPEAPAGIGDTVNILVTPEALADPSALSTLEGAPATAPEHVWQTVGTVNGSCGHIAGAPRVVDGLLWADVLITDPATIQRVMLPPGDPNRLEEISSGFDTEIAYEPGTADGAVFDGVFTKIRYNHVAILPPGTGRAGPSVRIVNQLEPNEMTDPTVRVRLSNGATVRVHNEDVAAVEKADAENAAKVDPAKMSEVLAQITALNEQIKALTAERDTLTGQAQAFKAELDKALNPETVEAAATAMNAEREDAAQVMNAFGVTMTAEQKKLHGHGLRTAVVNSINAARQLAALPADAPEAVVAGHYQGLAAVAKMAPKLPTGHQVVQVTNAQPDAKVQPNMANNTDRAARLYKQGETK